MSEKCKASLNKLPADIKNKLTESFYAEDKYKTVLNLKIIAEDLLNKKEILLKEISKKGDFNISELPKWVNEVSPNKFKAKLTSITDLDIDIEEGLTETPAYIFRKKLFNLELKSDRANGLRNQLITSANKILKGEINPISQEAWQKRLDKVLKEEFYANLGTTAKDAITKGITFIQGQVGEILDITVKGLNKHLLHSNLVNTYGTNNENKLRATDLFKSKATLDTLLDNYPNFFSSYKSNRDGMIAQANLTDEQVKFIDSIIPFIDKFISTVEGTEETPPLLKLLTSNKVFKQDMDKDFLSYLIQVDPDGKRYLNENLIAAVALNTLNWLGTRSRDTLWNDDDAIRKLLNKGDNEQVTREEQRLLRNVGLPVVSLKEDLGSSIAKNLALTVQDGAAKDNLNKLKMSLGSLGLAILLENGHLKRNNIKANVIATLKENGMQELIEGESLVNFVEIPSVVNEESNVKEPTEEILNIEKLFKDKDRLLDNSEIMEELFGITTYKRYPDEKPNTKVVEFLKGTKQKIPQVTRDLLSKMQKLAFLPKENVKRAVSNLGRDTIAEILGFNNNIDENTPAYNRLTAQDKNQDILKSINDTLDFFDKWELNKPLHFTYEVWKNLRIGITQTVMNPQANKLARHLIGAEGSTVRIPLGKEGQGIRNRFKRAVMASFGYKFEQKTAQEAIAAFDEMMEPKKEGQKGYKEYKNTQEAIRIMKKALRKSKVNLTQAEKDHLIKFVKDKGEGAYSLEGLVALAEYRKSKSFITNIMMETDGITNGPMIGLMQTMLEDGSIQMLAAGGIHTDGSIRDHGEWAQQNNELDNYKITATNLDTNLTNLRNTTSDKVKEKLDHFKDVFGSLLDDTGKVTGFARNLVKYPLMIVNFGGGLSKIREEFAEDLLEEYYNKLFEIGTDPDKFLDWDFKVDELQKIVGTISDEQKASRKDFELTPTQSTRFKNFINETYGQALEDTLTRQFSGFFIFRDYVNGMINGMFDLFKPVYDQKVKEAKAKYKVVELNQEQEEQILAELEELFPTVKSPISEGIEDSIAVIKTNKTRNYSNRNKQVQQYYNKPISGATLPNGKEAKSFSSFISERVYAQAGVGGLIMLIHSIDSSVIQNMLKDFRALSIFDAGLFSLEDVLLGTQSMNDAFKDINVHYSVIASVRESFNRSLNRVRKDYPNIYSKFNNNFSFKYKQPLTGEWIETDSLQTYIERLDTLQRTVQNEREKLFNNGLNIIQYAYPEAVSVLEPTKTKDKEDTVESAVNEIINSVTAPIPLLGENAGKELSETDMENLYNRLTKMISTYRDVQRLKGEETPTIPSQHLKGYHKYLDGITGKLLSFVNTLKEGTYQLSITDKLPPDADDSRFRIPPNSIEVDLDNTQGVPVVEHELAHAATVYGVFKAMDEGEASVTEFINMLKGHSKEMLNFFSNADAYTKSNIEHIYNTDGKGFDAHSAASEALAIFATDPLLFQRWLQAVKQIDKTYGVENRATKTIAEVLNYVISKVRDFVEELFGGFSDEYKNTKAFEVTYKAMATSLALNNTVKPYNATQIFAIKDKFDKNSSTGVSTSVPAPKIISSNITGSGITSANSNQIFNQLGHTSTSRIGSEHTSHLKNILSQVINKALVKANNLTIQAKQENDGIYLDGNKIIDSNERKPSNNQSSYVYELMKALSNNSINTKDNFHIRHELGLLFDSVKTQLTWESFLEDPNNSTPTEIQNAKDIYNDIFNKQRVVEREEVDPLTGRINTVRDNDYLSRFLSYGLADEKFNSLLKGLTFKTKKEKEVKNIFDRVNAIFLSLLDYISNKLYSTRGISANKSMEILIKQLNGIHSSNKYSVLAPVIAIDGNLSKGFNKLNGIVFKQLNKIKTSSPTHPIGKAFKTITYIPDIVSKSDLFKALADATNNIDKIENSFIKGLAQFVYDVGSEIIGRTIHKDKWLTLLRYSKHYIDQARRKVADEYTLYLQQSFNEKLTEQEETALYKSLLKTDAISLRDAGFNIQELLNPSAIDVQINKLKNKLSAIDWLYVNQAKGLGHWMVKGEGNMHHQMLNAYNIANLKGQYSTQLEKDIDTLASLYAFKFTDNAYKNRLKELFDREPEGVKTLLDLAGTFKENSLAKLFSNNKTQTIKGYTSEILDDTISVKVASLDDEAELKQEGYILKSPLRRDDIDSKARMGMYVSTSKAPNSYAKSIVSITNLTNKGSTLIDPSRLAQVSKKSIAKMKLQSRKELPIETTKTKMIPILNEYGTVSNFRYTMTEETKDTLLTKDNNASINLGKMFGSIVDKNSSIAINQKVNELLYEDFTEGYHKNPKQFINLADPKNKEYHEIFKLLPEQLQYDLRSTFGKNKVPVRRELVDLIFGYREFSITSKFKSDILKMAGTLWTELVSIAKTNIVIKTPSVMINNTISNTILLWSRGVPMNYIIKNQAAGVVALNDYLDQDAKLANLKIKLETSSNLTKSQKGNLERKINRLEDSIANNPVRELIDEGMFQSIVEDVELGKNKYSYKERLSKGVDSYLENYKDSFIVEAGKHAYMTQDTDVFKIMLKATQYSDFVARYTLYKHDTEVKKVAKDKALSDVMDTFIQYDIPSNKYLNWMNDIGLMMFTKFLLRIQNIIYKMFRNNPAKALTVYTMQEMFGRVSDINDSNILFNGVLGNFNSPLNIIDSATDLSGIDMFGIGDMI